MTAQTAEIIRGRAHEDHSAGVESVGKKPEGVLTNGIFSESLDVVDSPVKQNALTKWLKRNWFRPCVFALALMPFLALVYSVITEAAGANPIETIEKQTGEWTLRLFLLSLMATPFTEIFKVAWPVRLRRMIGLFAFFYATAHLLAYAVLDQSLNLADIVTDVVEKPFITAGFAAFLILAPLAVTSNRYAVKRLGRRWKSLHRWVYVSGVLALLHYVWLAKGERLEPVIYLLVLLLLLAYRVVKVLSSGTKVS